MITNEKGEVAVAYYMTIPQHVRVKTHDYIFSVRNKICMAWVKSEDVPVILSITKECGCSHKSKMPVFRLATAQMVRLWEGIADR